MQNQIIFVGGIHGVGKGTLCRKVTVNYNFQHLAASEVLKWSKISSTTNKIVDDISLTQEMLIQNLEQIIKPKVNYLLDGHFTLFSKNKSIHKIEIETFKKINPISIFVLTSSPNKIVERLKRRDKVLYKMEEVRKMQTLELEHGYNISQILKIPFFRVEDGEFSTVSNYLQSL